MRRHVAIDRYQAYAAKAINAFRASERHRATGSGAEIVRECLDEAYRWAREAASVLHELFGADPAAAHVLARDWSNYTTHLGCPPALVREVDLPTG